MLTAEEARQHVTRALRRACPELADWTLMKPGPYGHALAIECRYQIATPRTGPELQFAWYAMFDNGEWGNAVSVKNHDPEKKLPMSLVKKITDALVQDAKSVNKRRLSEMEEPQPFTTVSG